MNTSMKNVLIVVLIASTAVLAVLLYQERQEPSLSEAVETLMETTKPAVEGLATAIAAEIAAEKQRETVNPD